MYRPLPDVLTIGPSKIDGLGLLALDDIEKGTVLGISHIHDERMEDKWIRTPLGGFINHSNNANCAKMKDLLTNFYHLIATRDIEMGEELTVTYTLYKIDNGD
tara:strand:- start:7001 stop:7309 length:309 start_codon:yes stop_codon:yes gene_type:complete